MIPDIMRTFIRYSLDKYISHIEQEQQRDQQEQQDERQDEQGVIVASGRSAGAYQQQQDQFLYHQNRLTAPITKTNLYRNNRNMLSPDDDGISNFIIENINNHSIEILSDDDLNTSLATALSQVLLASPTSVILGSQENVTVEDINSFYFYETEQFTVLWVLFAIIVLGNSAVLVTLLLNKKSRQSRMNYFIKQLAIADLSVGIINVLTDIIWRITVEWRAGNVACKFIRFLQCLVTYASTYVLVSLSIDRYDAITHPMNFSGSWKRARRLVAAAWILSALFSSPMLVLFEERLIQEQRQCWIELDEPWRWQLYMSLVSTALFLVPTIIISACYAIILKTIWSKGTLLGSIDRSRTGDDRGSRRASSRGIIPRAKVKTVKMTIVIVIVFIFCWSPYIIFDLLQVFGKIPRTQTNIAVATFIQSLAPLNSAANPLIYCIFSTEVCRAIRQLPPFRWIASSWCCKSHSPTSTANRCATRRLHNHNNNSDSMRTFTTSISSRRSTSVMRGSRVVIMERPKTLLTMSEFQE